MADLLQRIKDRPIATLSISSFIALAGAVLYAWTFATTTFVLAADYKRDNAQTVIQINNIQKARVEDELFKLEQIPVAKRKDVERAMIERFKRKLDDIRNANAAGKPVE